MSWLTTNDLQHMALGSAVLGSGGGGDPSYDLMMAKWQLENHGPVKVIQITDLTPGDLVVPLAYMGAPLVGVEKIPSGREFSQILASIEKYFGKRPTVLIPIEIGGGNALTPFAVAGSWGLPVLDADMIGRAFPELQMSSCHLKGALPTPAFLADSLGHTVIIETGDSVMLEKTARHITVSMGSCSALAMYIMSGAQAASTVIPGSLARAIEIGKTMAQAQKEGKDPLRPLLDKTGGACLGSGKITDIDQEITGGFLKGKAILSNDHDVFELMYQNEYLAVKRNGKYIATTPDILMLLEQDSGSPITSESLQYGIQVNLVALPSPTLWKSPAGLAMVGPEYFGYETKYKPFNQSE